MKLAHKQSMSEKYPNQGTTIETEQREVPEENHWQNHDEELIKKKYLQFMVMIEYLNNVLELPMDSKMSDLMKRSHDLYLVNAKYFKDEN